MSEIENLKTRLESSLHHFIKENVVYTYSSQEGILKDRMLHVFTLDNPHLKRKIDIVYCKKRLQTLEGFLIDYKDFTPNYSHLKHYVSLNRLRGLLNHDDVVFHGNKQYDLSYKVEEIIKVVEQIKFVLTSKNWIDFPKLEKIEKDVYVIEYETSRKNSVQWIIKLVQKISTVKELDIMYNPIEQPPYEKQNLMVKNNFGDIFEISHGHFSRYDSGYIISWIKDNKVVKSKKIYDAASSNRKLISFCKNKQRLH